jgi:hypothetical protein
LNVKLFKHVALVGLLAACAGPALAQTKISALPAVSSLVGTEVVPVVQSGTTKAATLAQVSTVNAPMSGSAFMVFDGDSKGLEPLYGLQWAVARTPVLVDYGGALNIGGTGTCSAANQLTNTTRMATAFSTVAALVAAGKTVDVSLKIGTNDVSAVSGCIVTNDQILANIRKAWANYQAAGARYLFLWNVDPRGSTNASQVVALNKLYEGMATSVPNVIYMDATAFLVDPSTNVDLLGVAAPSAAGSVSTDNLHLNMHGLYRESYAWEPALLQRIYPVRRIQSLQPDVNSTTAPRGNVYGTLARFVAIGGTDSTTKSGTASVTGTPPNGWSMTGSLDGSLSLTFAQVTCTALDAYTHTTGSKCVRMTMSGTPTTSQLITFTRTSSSISITGGQTAENEILVNFNAVNGLCLLQTKSNRNTGQLATPAGGQTCNTADLQLPQLDGLYYFTMPAVAGTFSGTATSVFANFYFKLMAGVPVSGSIDWIAVSERAKPPIPAPAP